MLKTGALILVLISTTWNTPTSKVTHQIARWKRCWKLCLWVQPRKSQVLHFCQVIKPLCNHWKHRCQTDKSILGPIIYFWTIWIVQTSSQVGPGIYVAHQNNIDTFVRFCIGACVCHGSMRSRLQIKWDIQPVLHFIKAGCFKAEVDCETCNLHISWLFMYFSGWRWKINGNSCTIT